jgi:DNA-binding transcriptional LysR family regulator
LEQELGVLLFDRSARRPHLTPYGKLVFDRARRILSEARDLQRDVHLMKNNEFGEARFGVGPFPAASLLVPMLTEMAQTYPKVRLRVEVGSWQRLVELLVAEQLDFAITHIREVLHQPFLAIAPLPRLRMRCFCRSTHPILKRKKISLKDIADFPLISVQHPKTVLAEMCHEFGIGKNTDELFAVECDNVLAAEEVTLQTDMILVGPRPVRRELKRHLIELKALEGPNQLTHFGIIELRNRTRSPAIEVLLAMAKRLCDSLEQN